jgi:hypothetical protein
MAAAGSGGCAGGVVYRPGFGHAPVSRRYAQFPAPALDGAAPWAVWLGALVPVDGIWRSTGNGTWLGPVEGDAVAEYADQAA